MATDRTRSPLRGLLVQDPRLLDPSVCLWAAESSYTQAGPRPGVPEAQGDYELVLQTTGDQSAAKQLRIQSLRGGHPTGEDAGGFVWRYQGDPNWRGWNAWNESNAWEAIVYSNVNDAVRDPHAITLPDEQVLVAYESTGDRVRVVRRATDGTWGAPVTVYQPTVNPTYRMAPCLCLLPDDSVLLFHWIEDQIASESQIRVWRSTDSGTTWTLVQSYALEEWAAFGQAATVRTAWYHAAGVTGAGNTGALTGRIRAAYNRGTLLLIAEARLNDTTGGNQNRDVLVQFASDSLGKRFVHVYTGSKTTTAEFGVRPEVVVAGGLFHLVFGGASGTEVTLNTRRIATAFQPYNTVDLDEIADWEFFGDLSALPRISDDCDVAACVDDTGTIYVIARQVGGAAVATDGELDVFRSTDLGETWESIGRSSDTGSSGEVHGIVAYTRSNLGACHLRAFSLCAQRGRGVLVHSWDSEAGTWDDSLAALYLGGYATVSMPGFKTFGQSRDRVGWEHWWAPLDTPGSMGWASAGAGTATLQVPGELNVVTVAQARSWNVAPAGTDTEGITVAGELNVNSNTSGLGGDYVAILVRVSGASRYSVSLRFSTTTLRVWDNEAGAQVGSDFTGVSPSTGIQVLVGVGAGKVSVWARPKNTSSDRVWTGVVSNAALTAAAATTSRVEWGHIAVGTANSDWTWLSYSNDNWNGTGLHTGQLNPDDLWARAFARDPVAVDDGVRLRALDGPARRNDNYNVDTRYDYAVERMFALESRSPRVRWRSTGTGQATIALAFDPTILGTAESRMPADLIGIALLGINWRTGKLQYYDVDTLAWITLATIDAATDRTAMAARTRGATIVPNGAGQPWYAFTGDFAGGTFHYGSAGGGSVYRRVKWHGEGQWSSSYAGRKLDLHLDGMLGTEPATTADGSLWSPNVCVVANVLGVRAAGLRLVIDAQSNVDGYFEIGDSVVGPVYLFGQEYGWDRRIVSERGWERETAHDLVSRTRQAAPDPRVVEMQWTEGVDVSDVFSADPDYVTASATAGAEPIASKVGTPYEIVGLARLTRDHPVVYIGRYPRSTGAGSDVVHLTRPHEFLYGVLDSDVELEALVGGEQDPASGELLRIGTIRVREEV